jgi:hypothetical protein
MKDIKLATASSSPSFLQSLSGSSSGSSYGGSRSPAGGNITLSAQALAVDPNRLDSSLGLILTQNVEILAMLLDNGADPRQRNIRFFFVFFFAVSPCKGKASDLSL